MKAFFSRMMKGIETARNVMLNAFFIFFIVYIIALVVYTQPSMPERVVLQLDLKGALVEQVQQPEFSWSSLASPEPKQVKVHDIVTALQRAAKDERVLAVRLDLQALDHASLVHLRVIRSAIEAFKTSGKPVMAYADHFSQAQYYLAASADKVFLHPLGNVGLNGYSLYRNYVREALDNLYVDIHVFKAGRYKSAAAPLMHNAMSDDEREANQLWLNTLWNVYKDDLFAMRGIDQARLQQVLDAPAQYIRQYDGDLAKLFLAEHWVDGLTFPEQADAFLMDKVGDAELLGFKAYLSATGSGFLPAQPKSADNWVAVITGSGQILSGEQPSGTIGSDTMVELLQTAHDDVRVKAVVLRLNTPGGSALASESIRHAVEMLRAAGKPVVVSMGSMAASGGYWIAAAADEIWASPATLTGSIGVFGILPNIHKGLQKLGIHTDGLGTTTIAGALRMDKPLNPLLAEAMQLSINQTYQQFLQHVAKGRDMDMAQVQALAQGRVWSGKDAQALGLVDALGDINDAIQAAARLAHIEDNHEPIIIEPPRNPLEMLMENVLSEVAVHVGLPSMLGGALLPKQVQQLQAQWQDIQQLDDPRGVYALTGVQLSE